MTYHELLSRLSTQYETGEARAILRLFLEKRFSLSWTEVLCGAVEKLNDEQTKVLEESVRQLEKGVPVQYVLGEADFLGHSFRVAEGVLIPRPETEQLVLEASAEAEKMLCPVTILDVGTGSGCIAISLALQNKDWIVVGWDISEKALSIANDNAKRLGVTNVAFFRRDVLGDLTNYNQRFSVIVSNPPYVCNKEKATMEKHVLDFEPSLALFVPDDDPLLFYRAITEFAKKSLLENGALLFEINREYGKEVANLMLQSGLTNVEILKDQFGNDRFVKGKKA